MLRDLRYACRMLVKTPGFTIIAILAIALGIGASTTMFSSINALLLRPMPLIQDQDRLVAVSEFFAKVPDQNSGTAFPDYLDWKKQVTTLEGIAAIQEATFIVSGGDKPERYLGGQISADAFSFLGVQPILGRLFRPEEDHLNAAPVALIGYDVWQNHFGGDRGVVGKLIPINGKQVKAGDNYWQLLNNRLNRKAEVTFNNKASEDGAWATRIETISPGAYSNLRYERWVKERRKKVDELSGGRIGYLHIQAMNPPSLRKFEKEIPKVVLQNWRSASNAEMFPAGFRALGLGKVIGTPTMGAVIGTGSYSLIDGSTVRTPGVGVFLADAKHTNMENYGVQPDIRVDNSPADNLAGRDRQLEVAVEELMKELQESKRNLAKKD